jgi:hypothetical protein
VVENILHFFGFCGCSHFHIDFLDFLPAIPFVVFPLFDKMKKLTRNITRQFLSS